MPSTSLDIDKIIINSIAAFIVLEILFIEDFFRPYPLTLAIKITTLIAAFLALEILASVAEFLTLLVLSAEGFF